MTSKPSEASFRGPRALLFRGTAIAVVAVIALASAALVHLRHQVELRTAITTQKLAKTIELTFDGLIDTIDIALLASADEISRQYAAGRTDRESVSRFLEHEKERLPQVAYLRAMDGHGDLLYGPGIPSPPSNNADRDYFARLQNDPSTGLMVRKPVFGHVAKKWLWSFARRIDKQDGSFGGIVIAAIYVDQIDRMIAQIQMPPGVSITLRGADLGLVARFQFLQRADDPTGDTQLSVRFSEALRTNLQEGTYSVSGGTSIDGVASLHSYVRSAKYGFTVNVGISDDLAYAEWRKEAEIIAALAAALIIAVLAFSWQLSRAWDRQEIGMRELEASEDKARNEARLRREAEALDAANATLRAVLDNTPISIGVVGDNRTYVFGNKFFCDDYGISPADLVGRSPRMVFCSDADFEALGAAAYPVIFGGGIYDCEQRLRRGDGSEYPARVIGRRIDPANPSLGTVWVLNDLTDSKLAEASRIKSEFLAMMSHEMRTPLNGIIGLLSAVTDLPEAAPLADTLRMVSDSADSLLTIIGDILDFSLLERGEFHIAETDFNPVDVVGGAEAIHRDRALAKGIAFTVRVDGDVPRRLRGDGVRLGQIITNLVGNAVKFTDAGTVEVVVSASLERGEKATLMISVEDSGIGIPPEALERLFEPFTQADSSISRRFGGSGLGLAISRRLAQLMGGNLVGESDPGRGSRFRASLPFSTIPEEVAATPARQSAPRPATRPLNILVAEDNPTSRAVAEKIVARLGHAVVAVPDGRAAVDAVSAEPFDLVLMDMRMPVMDGLAATRAIRALPSPRCRVAVIGVTANAFPQDIQDCLDAGMDGYLSKPITLNSLATAIVRVLADSVQRGCGMEQAGGR